MEGKIMSEQKDELRLFYAYVYVYYVKYVGRWHRILILNFEKKSDNFGA